MCFSIGICQDPDRMLVGHNAVWSPNFYMLYNDLYMLLIEGLEYLIDVFQFNLMQM